MMEPCERRAILDPPMGRLWTRAVFAVLLASMGLLSPMALAACGGGESVGGGTVAGEVTRTSATASVSRPTPTLTRDAATVTETQSVTETESVTTVATTTQARPAVTITESTTVLTVAPPAEAESSDELPAWGWALLIVACGALSGLAAFLIHRHSGQLSAEERRRLLGATVASWAGAGWAIESQTGDSAVVVRGPERMLINVDDAGHVTSARLAVDPTPWPGSGAQ